MDIYKPLSMGIQSLNNGGYGMTIPYLMGIVRGQRLGQRNLPRQKRGVNAPQNSHDEDFLQINMKSNHES